MAVCPRLRPHRFTPSLLPQIPADLVCSQCMGVHIGLPPRPTLSLLTALLLLLLQCPTCLHRAGHWQRMPSSFAACTAVGGPCSRSESPPFPCPGTRNEMRQRGGLWRRVKAPSLRNWALGMLRSLSYSGALWFGPCPMHLCVTKDPKHGNATQWRLQPMFWTPLDRDVEGRPPCARS